MSDGFLQLLTGEIFGLQCHLKKKKLEFSQFRPRSAFGECSDQEVTGWIIAIAWTARNGAGGGRGGRQWGFEVS